MNFTGNTNITLQKKRKGHPFVFWIAITLSKFLHQHKSSFSHDNNINNNNFLRLSQHQASFDKPDTNCKNNPLKDNLLV